MISRLTFTIKCDIILNRFSILSCEKKMDKMKIKIQMHPSFWSKLTKNQSINYLDQIFNFFLFFVLILYFSIKIIFLNFNIVFYFSTYFTFQHSQFFHSTQFTFQHRAFYISTYFYISTPMLKCTIVLK